MASISAPAATKVARKPRLVANSAPSSTECESCFQFVQPDSQLAGEPGITGVMPEGFLVAGRQDFSARPQFTFGQSITDACMGWDVTTDVLHELASAVRARRAQRERWPLSVRSD